MDSGAARHGGRSDHRAAQRLNTAFGRRFCIVRVRLQPDHRRGAVPTKVAPFVQTLAALLAIATAQQTVGERFKTVGVLNDMPRR
jgi:hypothetical protein